MWHCGEICWPFVLAIKCICIHSDTFTQRCGHCVTSFPNDYQLYVYVCTCTEIKIVFAWLCVPWGCVCACSISAISSCCFVIYYRALRECVACRSDVNTWGLKYEIYHLLHVYVNKHLLCFLSDLFLFLSLCDFYFPFSVSSVILLSLSLPLSI